jgi:hypothetical protein
MVCVGHLDGWTGGECIYMFTGVLGVGLSLFLFFVRLMIKVTMDSVAFAGFSVYTSRSGQSNGDICISRLLPWSVIRGSALWSFATT